MGAVWSDPNPTRLQPLKCGSFSRENNAAPPTCWGLQPWKLVVRAALSLFSSISISSRIRKPPPNDLHISLLIYHTVYDASMYIYYLYDLKNRSFFFFFLFITKVLLSVCFIRSSALQSRYCFSYTKQLYLVAFLWF